VYALEKLLVITAGHRRWNWISTWRSRNTRRAGIDVYIGTGGNVTGVHGTEKGSGFELDQRDSQEATSTNNVFRLWYQSILGRQYDTT
jgi:hypothetical protein